MSKTRNYIKAIKIPKRLRVLFWGKRLMILIIVLAVLLIAVAGGFYYYFSKIYHPPQVSAR